MNRTEQESDRTQLNAAYYQQAVRFAEQFSPADKQAFLTELAERQAFEQTQQQALQNASPNSPLAAKLAWCAVVAVLVGSGLFYWQTGRYEQVAQGQQALTQFIEQAAEENATDRNDRYIVNLQNQLRQNPNHGDRWFELGQAYALNNDFSAAQICYQNAIKLLGRTPAILGAMATVEYYQHRQTLTPQAKAWIDEALGGDPHENASLLLLASDAFLHNDPKTAIDYWQRVLEGEHQAIDRRAIINSIKVAEQRLSQIR